PHLRRAGLRAWPGRAVLPAAPAPDPRAPLLLPADQRLPDVPRPALGRSGPPAAGPLPGRAGDLPADLPRPPGRASRPHMRTDPGGRADVKLGIMQPYFFPYLGYYQLARSVDHFVFLDDVSFRRGGFINRNRIMLDGQPFLFSLPVKDASSFRVINQHCFTGDTRKFLAQ